MLKAILCNKSVPRVEIDWRAREARLRLEQIERLLMPRAAVTDAWVGRVFCLLGFVRPGEGSRTLLTRRPLNDRRPRMPQIIDQGWLPTAL
jgi:hypothetical protein